MGKANDFLDNADYSDLVELSKILPMSWYPAVIAEMVEAAYDRKVFLLGGASAFVGKIEKRIGKVKPDGQEQGAGEAGIKED